MGKASKALTAFIKGIHDDKLKDIGESQHTIYQDTDFRLDMQGVSTSFELSSSDSTRTSSCSDIMPCGYR